MAYNSHRLTSPGSSKIKIDFELDLSQIRARYPNCTFIMRTAYFAPWNMSPCRVNVTVNDQKLQNAAEVPGENHGRTTHDSRFNPKDKNELEVKFVSGNGVLFLWYFELLI